MLVSTAYWRQLDFSMQFLIHDKIIGDMSY